MRFLFPLLTAIIASLPASADDWKNPTQYLGKLDSPLVEVTPFVFQDRYYLLENWQKQWEHPGSPDGDMIQQDEIRIRDMATDEVISMPLIGHGLGMAFVHEDRVYVFGGDWGTGKKWNITEITMVSSTDLIHWTDPVVVLKAEPHEKFFNVSVCRGPEQFALLVESNDPAWPAFTFKYFTSDNLTDWTRVPGAEYGREKYVGGPALYFEGDHYYTLYLHALGDNHYETRVARSTDLVHWQDAPDDRPVATFNKKNKVHPLRPDHIREQNASDLEFCYWDGKTRIYYTGGDQRLAGDLQHAEYDGTPKELLEHFFAEPEVPTPTANQQRYQEKQFGAFVHFGPASFIGGDDYLAAPEASVFNPEELDAEQWMRAAKAIGAQHIVLTAKHHNGFCLWPTETTDYSVETAPWNDGQGDVVREFVDAAREHGIAPGLYLSAGDTHLGCTATPDPRGVRKVEGDAEAYFPIFMEQLTELLTNYGELETIWFDGAYNPFDPDVLGPDGEQLGNRYAGPITETVRRLQPKAVIMGGAHPDVRWSGSEQGKAPYPLWNVVEAGTGREHWLPDDATGWFIPEANIHTRRHWFWSPDSDDTLKTVPQMMTAYESSIGHGANLLVNLTPDMRGLIPDAEMAMLEGFGEARKAAYDHPVATHPDPDTWEEGHTLRLRFDTPQELSKVVLEEGLSHGQRIRAYRIEALQEGKWKAVASGESIGRKRIQAFDAVTTESLRLKVTDNVPLPHVSRFAAY